MRRALAAAVFIPAVLLADAPSAAAPATGAIEGEVVNAATGRPEPGVVVTLTGGGPGDRSLERQTRADREGRYRFTGLHVGDEWFYALDARYRGGIFAGGAITLPEGTKRPPVITTKLRVWPTTTDPSVMVIRRDDIFLVHGTNKVGVIESVTIVNRGDGAYIGRAGAAGRATVGFALPGAAVSGGVTIVESDLDIPALVPTDFGFATTIAFPPGEKRIIFSYELSGTGATFDLSRTALYPTLEMSVFATPPLRIEGNRVEARGPQEIGGKSYDAYDVTDPLDAGDPLQLVAIAESQGGLGLGAGAIALLVAVAAVGVMATRLSWRRRRSRSPSRDDLLRDIAVLDIEHKTGDIDDATYERRRAALKARARRARSSGT